MARVLAVGREQNKLDGWHISLYPYEYLVDSLFRSVRVLVHGGTENAKTAIGPGGLLIVVGKA